MNLFAACQESLHQTERLLHRVDPVHYQTPHAACFGATLGQHVRHCLDHYEQFLDGVGTGYLDYDSRRRNPEIETHPDQALAQVCSLRSRLETVGSSLEPTQPVQVKIDCGGAAPSVQASTVGRELQFLISHTIHHFAIIGVMCNAMGIPLDPDFGVAPSTIRHRHSA